MSLHVSIPITLYHTPNTQITLISSVFFSRLMILDCVAKGSVCECVPVCDDDMSIETI